jgi:hypothetical protein
MEKIDPRILGLLIMLAAFWHVLGFAFGIVYVWASLKSLCGQLAYEKKWSRILRSADLHLWLSGFALIGLGVLQKGAADYFSNPKLWGKITVVVVWFLSTQGLRYFGVPRLRRGQVAVMKNFSVINVACWLYGALLGVMRPLSNGVLSYSQILAGFAFVILVSFIGVYRMMNTT